MSAASNSVLVIAPHPDDESLGCGGTIKHLTGAGIAVDVAFMTRGELGSEAPGAESTEQHLHLAEIRTLEAASACAVLGVRHVRFLNGRDGALAEQPELVGAIRHLLQEQPYSRVFCPWYEDRHEDHIATFCWVRQALEQMPAPPDVWLYEIWTPLPPTTFVPIDHTLDYKRRAIECYASQLHVLDYRAAFLGLAAYRAVCCPQTQAAEAFLVCEGRALRDLQAGSRAAALSS